MKLALKRFKFLGLLVLAFLTFVPILVFGIDTTDTGYTAPASTANKIIYPAGYPTKCVSNTSGTSYFVPTKTANEFAQFAAHLPSGVSFCLFCGDGTCNNGETCFTCSGDCGSCCRSNPSGIYGGALYSAYYNCGHTPVCNLYHTGAQGTQLVTSNKIGNSKVGGGCGVLEKQRYSQCASLVNANTICDGDPCANGIQNIDYATPRFCYGTYNYLLNSCVYNGSTPQALGSWGATLEVPPANGSNYYWYWTGYYYQPLPGTVATWGICGTIVVCGDTICSTSYGETCASCPGDCGACPPSCSDHTYQSACTSAGCYWHSYGYKCSEYPCPYYYDYESCTPAGCYWNYSYNQCQDY